MLITSKSNGVTFQQLGPGDPPASCLGCSQPSEMWTLSGSKELKLHLVVRGGDEPQVKAQLICSICAFVKWLLTIPIFVIQKINFRIEKACKTYYGLGVNE